MNTGWRKATRSGPGNTGNCLEARLNLTAHQLRDTYLTDSSPAFVAKQRSSKSREAGSQCAQTGKPDTSFQIRDSKLSASSPIVSVAKQDFAALLKQVG